MEMETGARQHPIFDAPGALDGNHSSTKSVRDIRKPRKRNAAAVEDAAFALRVRAREGGGPSCLPCLSQFSTRSPLRPLSSQAGYMEDVLMEYHLIKATF